MDNVDISFEDELKNLADSFHCGIINVDEFSAELDNLNMRKEKSEIVFKKFGEPYTFTKKKGDKLLTYYRIDIPQPGKREKQVTATKLDSLVEKLYQIMKSEDDQNLLVKDVFTEYLKSRRSDPTISSQTAEYDLSNWNKYWLNSDIAGMKIENVVAKDVIAEYKRIIGRGLIERKAFNKAKGLLVGIFNHAIECGYISHNIVKDVPTGRYTFRPAKDNHEDVYTDEQRDKLVKYLDSLSNPTIYALAVRLDSCFCMRIGELRALTWDDYDEEKGLIHIRHEIVQIAKSGKKRCDEDVPFTKGGKTQGIRTVNVSEAARDVLKKLRVFNGDKKYILNGSGDASFSISENRFNAHLRVYCEEAGIPYYSSHKFRFYGITKMYEAGVPESVIQATAGHTTVAMTQHYNRQRVGRVEQSVINQIFN